MSRLLITAKFHSTCPTCDRRINPGESVFWSRGEDAVHQACERPSEVPAPVPTVAPSAVTVSRPTSTKRPLPYMRTVTRESPECDWAPECIELFSVIGGVAVRAGEAFAIVRPGSERWPLGIASDHYKTTDHCAFDARLLNECAASIEPGKVLVSGHGYRVVYDYTIKHMSSQTVGKHTVSTRLVIAHDHTGKGSMQAAMCLYLDNHAIGAIVSTSAMHVAAQPGIWEANIEGMIESAIVAQDAMIDLLTAAESRILDSKDRDMLAKKGLKNPEGCRTALQALVAHHKGYANGKITWGVWERSMSDDAIRAILSILPPDIGQALDTSLRSRRLSCVPVRRYSSVAA
jgi:hypothetical protein